MSESTWKEEAVRDCSQWLDSDEEKPFAEPDSPVNRGYLEHLADLQLIDALLCNMSEPAGLQREDRIRAVMDAIDDGAPSRRAHVLFRQWYPFAAIAAGLLITCCAFWLHFPRATVAEELLHRISQVSLENTDRVYHFERVALQSGEQRERDGKLYLRGVEGFVLETDTAVFGRNGNEFWFVASGGRVVVADDFEWLVAQPNKHRRELALLKELSIESRHVPLMELPSVVKLMQNDYDVNLQSGKRFGQHRVDELIGVRRSATSDLPNTIRLWSGKDSQIIYRAEFSWERGGKEIQNNRIILELRAPEVIPGNWYQYDAHSSADQPVRRVSSGP